MQSFGLIYIFTGDGKGKTSVALGTAIRAAGHGKKVVVVQWYKEKKWNIGEHNIRVILRSESASDEGSSASDKNSLFHIYPLGLGFYNLPTDHASKADHQKAAHEAMKLAEKLLSADNLFLLILDEVLNAVHDKLISSSDLSHLISKRGSTHLILTGRNCPKKLIELADLVTAIKNIKHPFQKGQKAILGLDY